MNTSLTVRKTADTNWRPVMYRVVEMTPGNGAAATYCVIMCVRVGWDTEVNFNNWKATKNYPAGSPPVNPLTPIQPVGNDYTNMRGRMITGMQGTLGALESVALSTISIYNPMTPDSDM
jgi:hypothetical protein